MVHHWQSHFGKCSPSNPHNREWAGKMISIGLQPSNTGLPGGKQTGYSMNDYILPDGPFLKDCNILVQGGFQIPWMDRHAAVSLTDSIDHFETLANSGVALALSPVAATVMSDLESTEAAVIEPNPPRPATRFKYQCSDCSTCAWAAADVKIICGDCHTLML